MVLTDEKLDVNGYLIVTDSEKSIFHEKNMLTIS